MVRSKHRLVHLPFLFGSVLCLSVLAKQDDWSLPPRDPPSRFPVLALRMRTQDESGYPASRARCCVSLHLFHCIFHGTNIILSLVFHNPIDDPTYYVAALGSEGRSVVHRGRRVLVHAVGQ